MTAEDEFNKVLLDILKQETSPEAVKAKNLILRRIATENTVAASRIPQPLNITEIGGYLNLLEKLGHTDLQYGMLASTLGLPPKNTEAEFYDREPVVFFTECISDRPTCKGVESLPLTFAIRSDFAGPFASMLEDVRAKGGNLPLLSPIPSLPMVGCIPDDVEAMKIIGRCMEIAPSAMTGDAADPIIIKQEGIFTKGVGKDKDNVPTFSIDRLLAKAGWYPRIERYVYLYNTTGLVVGRTTYGDELSRIYTGAQIARSGVRELITNVWDGSKFANPKEVSI